MIFLKLGGSLITDKSEPETVRHDVLQRTAAELFRFVNSNPSEKLILGHGSGSFGHHHAAKYQTQLGAHSEEEWRGFSEVWSSANRLNVQVMDALREAGVPALRFAPSSAAVAANGRIGTMCIEPILHSLDAGLLPVVHGDVAFDSSQGATILSTEEIFRFLASFLHPTHILLAGIDAGVYGSYADKTSLLDELTPDLVNRIHLGRSQATDVTGGMRDKVTTAFELLKEFPNLQIFIFSGLEPGSIERALGGSPGGTKIYSASSSTTRKGTASMLP
jgi:isopentenyl phosphate kinase